MTHRFVCHFGVKYTQNEWVCYTFDSGVGDDLGGGGTDPPIFFLGGMAMAVFLQYLVMGT